MAHRAAVLSLPRPKSHFVHANMAEFGAAGAGRRDEDRRARKEGKKLLKKALGAAGVLKGGKHKEKLRREKERRRAEEQARAHAEAREMAARRAELHQRAVARALAQKETETGRRCQATERALDGAQRNEQALREQVRATEWEKEQAERERARWYEEAGQARSTAEAQRSRAEFYVTEAQRRDAAAAIASRQDDAHIDAARAEAAARTVGIRCDFPSKHHRPRITIMSRRTKPVLRRHVDLGLQKRRKGELALGRLDEERRRARGRLGRVERVEHVVLVAP